MKSATCGKCGGAMGEGFVAVRNQKPGTRLAGWYEGEPTRWWWGSLKLRGRVRLEVTGRRCARCGFLELFAEAPR